MEKKSSASSPVIQVRRLVFAISKTTLAMRKINRPCRECEENVWKLCDHIRTKHPSHLEKCFVVFISNEEKQVPLWHQKASKRPDRLVVWDYHVVLVYQHDRGGLVYDLDTELLFPSPLALYVEHAIGDDSWLKPEFHRRFRVVAGEEYLKEFASDRSHMTKEDGTWMVEPPTYPCIQTLACQNNLADFISMQEGTGVGKVVDTKSLVKMFSQ
ncbi:protein N-terminal glutamine amidohydrolase-like isoform X1 [Pomacea canaliculata]|uniref:protein N-terminal glutamine amidohydrolase-like isoform X1 n=1 Tax=Pomacea canaliculata TaxID=400727 RepID=UPI000D73946C|nr:protein N-terminal glutamine amidohydrolase-like isoform X1 [Pomacea canaliculata]